MVSQTMPNRNITVEIDPARGVQEYIYQRGDVGVGEPTHLMGHTVGLERIAHTEDSVRDFYLSYRAELLVRRLHSVRHFRLNWPVHYTQQIAGPIPTQAELELFRAVVQEHLEAAELLAYGRAANRARTMDRNAKSRSR